MGENIEKELDYIKIAVQKLEPAEDEFIVIRYDMDKMTQKQMEEIHGGIMMAFRRGIITLPLDVNIKKMSKEKLIDLTNGLQRLIAELTDNEDKND